MNYILTKLLPQFISIRLEGRTALQKILANTGWLFVDKILRMGVGLLVGVWVARYLGPEQFGLYNYALSFVALFSTFATMGLDGIVIRDIVRDPSYKDEILGTAFVLKLLGGISTLIFAVAAVSLLRPHENLTRWLVGIIAAGMIFQAFDAIDFWFQSQVQSKYTVYAKNVAFLVITLVKIVLIIMKAPLIGFAWAGLSEVILGAVGLVIAYRVNGHYLKAWRGSLHWAETLLKDSWPLILSGAMIAVFMRIDQVMLSNMIGDEAVGLYSAAVRISEVWYFIPMVITSSLFPAIINAKKHSEDLYYKRLQKLLDFMVWMSVAMALLTTFLSRWIVNLLYGYEYNKAANVLMIHIWAGVFVSVGVFKGKYMLAENIQWLSFVYSGIGAIVNVILNYFLIKKFGINGAAISTLIAQAISAVFLPLFHKIDRISILMFFKSFSLIQRKN